MAMGLRNSITIWILLLLIFQVEGRGYPVKVQSQRGHHDCIDIYKEPVFHNPLQKNHSHQMWRSSISEGTAIRSSSHKSKPCPAGTVFIIRWKPSHPQTKIVWWKWYSRSIFIAYGRWEMMMFVIVPFGVFVGLFVLAFISLCLLRRCERRRRMYQTVAALAPAPAPAPALGLERQEIEMFQISAYVAPKRESSEDDELCAICLEEYEAGQLLRTLTCTHKYHATCIDRWLSSNRTCPECRQRYPA